VRELTPKLGKRLHTSLRQHPSVDLLCFSNTHSQIPEWNTYLITTEANAEVIGQREDHHCLFDLAGLLTKEKNLVSLEDDFPLISPPFISGWFGHLSYEVGAWLESSLQLGFDKNGLPAICFRNYEASLSWHVQSKTMWLFGKSKQHAEIYLEAAEALIDEPQVSSGHISKQPSSDVSREHFQTQVQSIQDRILAGEFFQANLTRMLSIDLGDTSRAQLAGFSKRLLTQSEAPFGAILNFENTMVVSASPERFFRIEPSVEGRKIFAEPIKGTRPRHEDPELDEALKQDLVNSEKDRAENIMIADLVRNDLSRVCKDESIVADPICELRSFKNVHHLVTRVSGILRDDVSNLDALLAQFPCGSITGAPKWAAMDAIAELEQRGRGIYCGTIGYFDDRGHADFSVAIRTAVASFVPERSEQSRSAFMQDGSDISKDNGKLTGTTLTYGTGGGITILSDPEEEFTETEDKAVGFLRALQL
jgi:para-aminobenzoate synthetase component 1